MKNASERTNIRCVILTVYFFPVTVKADSESKALVHVAYENMGDCVYNRSNHVQCVYEQVDRQAEKKSGFMLCMPLWQMEFPSVRG